MEHTIPTTAAAAGAVLLAALCATFWALAPAPARAADGPTVAEIVDAFSDEELIEGFLGTVFGSETFRRGRQDPDTTTTVKKFAGPVEVRIINRSEVDRSDMVRRFLRTLDSTVRNLTIRETRHEDRANMVVFLVDRAEYRPTIRATMPESFDTRFLEYNACSAVTGGRRSRGLERAFVYLVANEGRSGFRHCMIEEIAQSLGPVNDDAGLSHSIFNDGSRVGGFGVFDWFILNMLYDRRVKNGMTETEVIPVLPAAISDARRRLPAVLARRDLHAR